MTETPVPEPRTPRPPVLPDVSPLVEGEKRVYFSPPVFRTSILLSVILLVVYVGLWFALEEGIRAMFTWPQIGTLIFFMMVMWAIMLGLGFSRMTATTEGVSVRNWFFTKKFVWEEVLDMTYGAGDSWPYLQLTGSHDEPEGRDHMVLGIQRTEGDAAIMRVLEVKALIKAQREALGLEEHVEED